MALPCLIDNTSAIAGLVSGYSAAVDSGKIVNAFHAYNVGLQSEPYFEYVRSEANVADLPSRGRIEEIIKVLRQCGVKATPQRIECKIPDLTSWACLAETWVKKGKAERTHKSSAYSGRKGKKRKHAEVR